MDASVLTLNALLGLGTALAPVFVAIFVGLGFWQGLPVLSPALLLALLVIAGRLPLRAGAGGRAASGRGAGIPPLFWIFAAFAVLYGICETMNGNWSQLDMTKDLHASAAQASFALTAFWAMVTAGRVLFALITRWFPATRTYRALPFLLAAVFVLISVLPAGAGRRPGSAASPWPGSAAPPCCRSPSVSPRSSCSPWAPPWPAG